MTSSSRTATRSGDAAAWNANHTGQSNEQSQKGVGGDARSGDATAEGGCCDHGKGKPAPCKEQHPKPYGGKPYGEKPCKDGPKGEQHGPSATSGKAKGGDVDQRQQAQNDNRTAQDAEATSKAKQFGALNLALPIAPGKHAGPVCRSC